MWTISELCPNSSEFSQRPGRSRATNHPQIEVSQHVTRSPPLVVVVIVNAHQQIQQELLPRITTHNCKQLFILHSTHHQCGSGNRTSLLSVAMYVAMSSDSEYCAFRASYSTDRKHNDNIQAGRKES
jgi:hypothetical protein